MRARAALALALLMLAGASALAVLPARWWLPILPADAPVSVVDARGSFWSGNATLAVGQGTQRRTLGEPLDWTWRWRDGAARVVLRHAMLAGELVLTPGWGRWHVSAQTLRLPAHVLPYLDARASSLRLDGGLTLRWSEQSITEGVWVEIEAAPATRAALQPWFTALGEPQNNRYLLRID